MPTIAGKRNPSLANRRAQLFRGLAEPSRLRILYALGGGPLSVSDIAEAAELSQPNTSNHLACLVGCGLVVFERRGRFVFYRHADDEVSRLLQVADWIVRDPTREKMECPQCGSVL